LSGETEVLREESASFPLSVSPVSQEKCFGF